MHVGHGARLAEKIGAAGAIARVDGHRTSRARGDALGESLPVRDRTQAFMKKDEFRCIRDAARNALHFEAPTLHRYVENIFLLRDSVLHFDDIGRLHDFFCSKRVPVLFGHSGSVRSASNLQDIVSYRLIRRLCALRTLRQ